MFWNSVRQVPITKYPKKCLGHYCNQCFWWLKMAAHKIKSDFWPKKWLLDFWPCQKEVTGPKLQKWAKYWLKTSFGWYLHFMTGKENKKSLFCQKNHFGLSEQVKKMQILTDNSFCSFFGPFFQLWSDDLFWHGQKAKSVFSGQQITFDLMSSHF